MSDRYNGFVVTLSHPIKDEDAEAIKDCILMLKNVIDVRPIVDELEGTCIRVQVTNDLKKKLYEVLIV